MPNQKNYSPLSFLSSLGAGGLAITFFMYLMWMTPHKGVPIPNFLSLYEAFSQGAFPMKALIVVSMTGIAVFALLHLLLLAGNIRGLSAWKKTPAYEGFRHGNNETQLMAFPLTLAMTMNVLFIAGAVFVPDLWDFREYLLPLSLIYFSGVGVFAFSLYLGFIGRIFSQGGFDCSQNNSLGQMISVFAFSMVGVGFSASAAMSHEPITQILGFLAAMLFIVTAVVLGVIKLVLGFRAMMEHQAATETSPTLWVIIPILTVLGIAIYRLKMAMIHNYAGTEDAISVFFFLSAFLSVQLLFGLIGLAVMKRLNYFAEWITGDKFSPGSWTLICPGVALFVFGNFFINAGLVRIGVIEPLSTVYFVLYVPLVVLQLITIRLFFMLYRKRLV